MYFGKIPLPPGSVKLLKTAKIMCFGPKCPISLQKQCVNPVLDHVRALYTSPFFTLIQFRHPRSDLGYSSEKYQILGEVPRFEFWHP